MIALIISQKTSKPRKTYTLVERVEYVPVYIPVYVREEPKVICSNYDIYIY